MPAAAVDETGTSVLVVDDHSTFAELLTEALNREPDFFGVGHATTAEAAVEMYVALQPELVLMDIQLPVSDGFEATKQILALDPRARVVMLTAHARPEFAGMALLAGACGFIAKDGHLADILGALRSARSGQLAVPAHLMMRMVADVTRDQAPVPRLSEREQEVLNLLALGEDVHHIAQTLHISTSTCRGHVKGVLAKLGAHTQLEAVVSAARLGLVTIAGLPPSIRDRS